MNEMEHSLIDKTLGAIHDLELKMVEQFTELKSEMKRIEEKVDTNGHKFDAQTETETKRLDKHSEELDDIREDLTVLKTKSNNNWKWFIALAAWAAAIAALLAIFF